MLISACERGDSDAVSLLIGTESLESKNAQGYNALLISSKSGYVSITIALLDAGANVNAVNNVILTQ